jgi:phage I-like protein
MNLNDLAYSVDLTLYAFNKQQDTSRVLIAVEGKWDGHHSGNPFSIDKNVMENMLANFNNQKIDTVCDYEHQTLTVTEGSAPASGWIKSLAIEEDKLFAFVEWTNQAKELIKNKEYRYVSPVFLQNTKDRVTGQNIGWTLHSLALTNRPFLEELGEVFLNSKDNFIALRKELDTYKNKVIVLTNEIEKHKKAKIEAIVDTAIKDNKLRAEQREYALKIATDDLEAFNGFISNNRLLSIPPSDLYVNKNTYKSKKSDIDNMIEIASKQ